MEVHGGGDREKNKREMEGIGQSAALCIDWWDCCWRCLVWIRSWLLIILER